MITVTLQPPTDMPHDKPTYELNHLPNRKWVHSFTAHLSKIEYKIAKRQSPWFIRWGTPKFNYSMVPQWTDTIKEGKQIVGYYGIYPGGVDTIQYNINGDHRIIMQLSFTWESMLKWHDLIKQAIDKANNEVRDTEILSENRKQSRMSIYNQIMAAENAKES